MRCPKALRAIVSTPVIVIMGDSDELVDVHVTRSWVVEMEKLGMNYEYVEIPGGDHRRIMTSNPPNMARSFDFFDKARDN